MGLAETKGRSEQYRYNENYTNNKKEYVGSVTL